MIFLFRSSIMFSMANVLSNADRTAVIAALVEGCSIRATSRMTGVARNTVTQAPARPREGMRGVLGCQIVNLPCKRLQVDEIWEFCYAKAKNVPAEKKGVFGYGDVWTFVAIDADTKLVPSWLVGSRDIGCATELMQDLAGRLVPGSRSRRTASRRISQAVEDAFGGDVDFAQLHKIYGAAPSGPETRYSPAECIGCEKRAITGNPDAKHVRPPTSSGRTSPCG